MEQGSHNELMELQGYYFALVNADPTRTEGEFYLVNVKLWTPARNEMQENVSTLIENCMQNNGLWSQFTKIKYS